jgi:heme o synthase
VKSVTIEKAPVVEPSAVVSSTSANGTLLDFAELTKARLTMLVLLTTAVGYYLGAEVVTLSALFHAVFGTALAAAGAAMMHRTRMRPIPAGRMLPRDAAIVGGSLGAAGVLYLAIACNLLSAALAAATIAIYIFAYTPLKRISTTNTLVGAIPGALPPLIGWAAARNDLALPAWSLFAILFCWQMPHFFAIAWMYREDYARAGFRMLSSADLKGARSGRQSVVFALLLTGASIAPALMGLTSARFVVLELLLGVAFAALAARFYVQRSIGAARVLFFASIIYLPLLLTTLVLTKS